MTIIIIVFDHIQTTMNPIFVFNQPLNASQLNFVYKESRTKFISV